MARNSLVPFRSRSPLGIDPFLLLHRDMNRLFDDVLRGPGPLSAGNTDGTFLAPQINVSETGNEIRVTAELPGVAESDIHLDVHDRVLTVQAEKRLERDESKENFHFVERLFGTFQRSLQLPFAVDPDQVQAKFENGVLSITLPKTGQQDRSRRIRIQTGNARDTGSSDTGSSGAVAGAQQDAQRDGSQGDTAPNAKAGATATPADAST